LVKLKDLEEGIKLSISILNADTTNLEEWRILHQKELDRNVILRGIEESWRLRSRAIWLASGENNTKNFHNFANFNRARKHIWEISDIEGSVFTEP
jgi:hypothetical protein